MNTQELCNIFVAREYPLKYHTTLSYVWYPTCSKRIWVREKGRKCFFFFFKGASVRWLREQ
ncbi:AMM_1a_G0049610.mRNA.1.CDS.1 [Saccharomyces cerevisiae]|nr:AMM_1a_G0049610.mRNA.1.CDS.1 [Saccharomyces cerevisiae]CAI6903835.1 AMM_1a_G0049610.mRNA.1.CDS.1 [Saccharomyces cerevisiae]